MKLPVSEKCMYNVLFTVQMKDLFQRVQTDIWRTDLKALPSGVFIKLLRTLGCYSRVLLQGCTVEKLLGVTVN